MRKNELVSPRRSLVFDLCQRAYHEAEVSPLVQEVPVDIDAVRLAQVFGDQGPNGREILFFQGMLVLDIAQLARKRRCERRRRRRCRCRSRCRRRCKFHFAVRVIVDRTQLRGAGRGMNGTEAKKEKGSCHRIQHHANAMK